MSAGAAELTNSGVPVPNDPATAPADIAVSRPTPTKSVAAAVRTRTRERRMSAPGLGEGEALKGRNGVQRAKAGSADFRHISGSDRRNPVGGTYPADVGSTTCERRG